MPPPRDFTPPSLPQELLDTLRESAQRLDISGAWPSEDLTLLAAAGAMRWAVPAEFGGDGVDPLPLHEAYLTIAAHSLSTALILTQRDSGVGMLAAAENAALRDELLPALARDEFFTTVGIAQLTTSRQGGAPALRATPRSAGFQIDGVIPWSTGAAKAKFVIAGAVVEAGRQILFALPVDSPGVTVAPPMPLVALRSSWTSEIRCDGVQLDRRWLLRGPEANVLAARKSLPLGQAFLALGHARGGKELLARHDSARSRESRDRFQQRWDELHEAVVVACESVPPPAPQRLAELRADCTNLALRVAHAAVAIYKGAALLEQHPAQRLAREAMFLLVWSCPDAVIECTVQALTDG
jgi:alkylation response protein AidB-like acyl-CoA dehydrogenase